VRLAIIGGGIAGLTAALQLDSIHDVTIFEAGARVGGHTNTVTLELPGETHYVDTGFIVHNRRNYPVFCAMLDDLGVATQPGDMSFSVSSERSGLEYAGTGPGGLFTQRRNLVSPEFWSLLAQIARFGWIGRTLLAEPPRSSPRSAVEFDVTLDDFLAEHRFSSRFVDEYLVPLGSSIWSANPRTFGQFPVRALLRFMDNHGLLTMLDRPEWRTVCGGSQQYVAAVLRRFTGQVRLAAPVDKVRRDGSGAELLSAGGPERFDGVVLAVHSDQALALLSDPTDAEREVLGAIPYQRNVAVLHTDASLLPRSRRAWAAWNYHQPGTPGSLPTVTYWMNRLQDLQSSEQILVTLNREDEIDPAKVHGRFEYHHPVYSREGFAAQLRFDEINGGNATWFCGAWWGYGFHEDGAASGLRVARALGAGRP
jgi:predicted NAD/FAD-binding protein